MSILRVEKRTNYKIISSIPLNDPHLSWGARGLLLHLLGQADIWEVKVCALTKRGRGAGRDKIYSMLAELQVLGYCKKSPRQKSDGRMDGWQYDIFEEPITGINHEPPKEGKNRLRQSRNSVAPNAAEPSSGISDANYKEKKTNKSSNKAVAVKRPISSNWRPAIEVMQILEQKGIPGSFVDGAVPEFVLYWRDAGTPQISWGAKFVQYVKSQWEIRQGKTDRNAFDSLTDRSWAMGVGAKSEPEKRQITDRSAGEGGDE